MSASNACMLYDTIVEYFHKGLLLHHKSLCNEVNVKIVAYSCSLCHFCYLAHRYAYFDYSNMFQDMSHFPILRLKGFTHIFSTEASLTFSFVIHALLLFLSSICAPV